MERFLEKEIYAAEFLSKELSSISKLIEKGKNYIIVEYFENILDEFSEKKSKEIIKEYTKTILDNIYALWQIGFAHIDLNPGNIIITKSGELKICDFEFLHKYDNPNLPFSESYDLEGVPLNFNSDLPRSYQRRSIFKTWDGYFCKDKVQEFIKFHRLKIKSNY